MKVYETSIVEYGIKKITSDIKKVKIRSSAEIYEYVMQFYGDDIDVYESFFMVTLNRANNTTGYVKISQGGVFSTVVDIKIIAKYAIGSLCSNVIVLHNHPSGALEPSKNDDDMTKKVQKALELFEIKILDHLIISNDGYYSYADSGKLN